MSAGSQGFGVKPQADEAHVSRETLNMELALLFAGAFAAGLVDAVVGGGGLIQIPLLFGVFPSGGPATIFGTNKLSAIFGTVSASWRYSRRVLIPWRAVLPAAVAAFVCSYLGAMTVSRLPVVILKPVVLVLLVVVAAYTWVRKDFGRRDLDVDLGLRHSAGAFCAGGLIGFYDGFFGPGTGSFLIFLFIRMFGFDFLRASACAKIVNVMTNAAALLYFGWRGAIWWQIGLTMAVFNVGGALVGSQLAIHQGTRFVRMFFLIVVSLLIVRFSFEVFSL